MIAALAAGLLGQIEGIGAASKLSTAASSLASAFTIPDDTDSTDTTTDPTTDATTDATGATASHAGIMRSLSSQLHAVLLQHQQQSNATSSAPEVIGTDDLSGIAAHLA